MKTIVISASLTVSTVLDIVKSNGMYTSHNFAGIIDDDEKKIGKEYYGLKVIAKTVQLKNFIMQDSITDFVIGLGSVNHMLIRGKLFNLCLGLGLTPIEVISNTSYISADAKLGKGQIILPFASISPGCRISDNCCINNSVSIMEETHVGSNVLIAGNSFVGARCNIGDNVYIGPGVTVGSGVSIGENTIIGAGSLVLKDVPSSVFAAGSPVTKIMKNNHYISADNIEL